MCPASRHSSRLVLQHELVARTERVVAARVAVRRQQIARLPVFHDPMNAADNDQRPGVVHRQLHRCPRASAVRTERTDELRILAVLIVHRTAHREAPEHVLARRLEEHRIGIGELQRPVSLLVIEDENGVAPFIAVVGGNARQDVSHVRLAGNARAEGNDQVLGFPFRDVRLPQQRCSRVLLDTADGAYLFHIPGKGRLGFRGPDREPHAAECQRKRQ